MAQQFLDAPEVGSIVQHMRGERMPDPVQGQVLEKVGLYLVLFHNAQKSPVREPVSPEIDKKGLIRIEFIDLSRQGEVCLKSFLRLFAERHDPLLPSFTCYSAHMPSRCRSSRSRESTSLARMPDEYISSNIARLRTLSHPSFGRKSRK